MSKLADGSTLPAYTEDGSLHRIGERRSVPLELLEFDVTRLPNPVADGADLITYDGRVHVSETSDAEHLADLFGVLNDGEPITGALASRFTKFVRAHLGEEAVVALRQRSSSRFTGAEARTIDDGLWGSDNQRYVFGHTGV